MSSTVKSLAKNARIIEFAIYIIAASASIWLMMENLYWRHEVEHSADDGHGHEEDLSSEDLIQRAEADSTNGVLQLNVARMLWQKQEFEASYDLYRRFERHTELNADQLAELGHIYMAIKPNVESAKYFERALKIDSINYGALLGIGRLLYNFGDFVQAKPYFQKIVKHHSEKEISGIAEDWLAKIDNKIKEKREQR